MSEGKRSETDVKSRFNIEEIPLVTLFLATDAQKRIRLSADIVHMYALHEGHRVAIGFDYDQRAIAIKLAASDVDPTAANVDKRGYLSAGRFFTRTRLTPEYKRYNYVAEQNGWLVFVEEDKPELLT